MRRVVIAVVSVSVLLLFLLLLCIFSDTSESELHPTPTQLARIDELAKQMARDAGGAYDPVANVAFAIPVGGRTERSANLRRLLTTLVRGGAPPQNIFIFEDVHSRPDRRPSAAVQETLEAFNKMVSSESASSHASSSSFIGVRHVATEVPREQAEDATNFGIHLARHYKVMIDYMLVGSEEAGAGSNTPPPPFEFVVVIEDDLVLAPDTAKYFQQMSRVMRADDTIYCVSGHQDNAFLATSGEEEEAADAPRRLRLDPQQFAFRRGNHFMAPSWMMSRTMYTTVVRHRWLDASGEYHERNRLHLRNGHWDRFFDSLIGKRDCIFPEVPRIAHEGADGFTVSKKGQMELYTNLRLSQLPVGTEYGDLVRLTRPGYEVHVRDAIAQSIVLTALEESTQYRRTHLVYLVDAYSDRDGEWNAVLGNYFGLIGVGGYGGFEGYVKVRGVFRGVVIVRWMTNVVFLVGRYSPYFANVESRAAVAHLGWGVAPKHEACYPAALLTHVVTHYTRASVSPARCLLSCALLGYAYAGVVNGGECRCGTTLVSDPPGSLPAVDAGECRSPCLGTAARSFLRSAMKQSVSAIAGEAEPCGGVQFASVYRSVRCDHTKPGSSLLRRDSMLSSRDSTC